MEHVANLISNLIEVWLLFYYLKTVLNKKKFSSKYVLLWFLIIVLFNTFINIFLGQANTIGFICILAFMTLVFKVIFDTGYLSVFIGLITGLIVMFVIELITVNLIIYIFKLPPMMILELNIYRILAIIIAKSSYFLVIHFWVRKSYIFLYILNKKSLPIAFILLFNALIMYMSFPIFKYIEIRTYLGYIFYFTFTLSTIIFSWLIYSITKRMVKQEQREELMSLKIKEYENQNFYVKNMEEILQNIKAQRHDFNNHVSTLYGLIYLNKFEEAKKYILELAEDISINNKIVDVGHPVLTALINMKRDKILRENINLKLGVKLPQNLSFEYIDLSIIIGNLLDNSIEACLNSNISEPFINLVIQVKDNHLVIEVSNSKATTVNSESVYL